MEQPNEPPTQISGALRREHLRVAQEVDSLCDEFERAWQQGQTPSLSEFLKSHGSAGNTDRPMSTLFVELVKIDVEYRSRRGESPDLESYAREFPSYRALLSDVLVEDDPNATSIRPLQQVDMLGRFVLQEQLGAGTFGVVWKAWDPQLQRWVAIKQFRENVSQQHRTLFQREARAVARMKHPNVVQVLELGSSTESASAKRKGTSTVSKTNTPNVDFIAFEFVDGLNLKAWQESLASGRNVPADEVARIGLQLARGLEHVHEQGLIHRDFKPTNVLLEADGTAKIVDFGLARHIDAVTTISRDQTIMGTVPYMSPEQCRAEPVTAATDIYSLGVVIYELLAGQRPFSGSRNEMLQAIQFATPTPLSRLADVPEELEAICMRAMEKQLRQRYRTAKEMGDDLERFLAGEPVAAAVLGKTATFQADAAQLVPVGEEPPSRRRFLSWAAGSAMFAGLGTAALLLNREPNDGKRVALVTTDPPGANVAFVPVNPVSGDVIPSELEHASGVTPLRHRLRPATYLVVVYFEDDPTRFHEAYRKVPLNEGDNHGGLRHNNSLILENGDIRWDRIEIPDPASFATMARVPGPAKYLAGIAGSTFSPPAMCSIPGFLVDPFEFTVADYTRVIGQPKPPNLMSQDRLGPQQAVNLSWDQAVSQAEADGKRLLHEYEYEYVATALGKHAYPWGDELPDGYAEMDHLGDVGTPEFDRVRIGDVEVCGLFSNVAEWVQTMIPLYPEQEDVFSRAAAGERGERGIRGWAAQSKLILPGEQMSPRQRASELRTRVFNYIGFRCARSLAPRLRPEDFVSYKVTSMPNFELPTQGNP